jgi:hypothetical protein
MILRRAVFVAVLPAVLSTTVVADLLGVAPGQPLFNYDSGGTTVFDAANGALNVNATPLDYTQVGGTPLTIFPLATAPAVTLSISLDSACNLVGGDPGGNDLTVAGDIDLAPQDFVPEYSGTLLTGEIVEFGVAPGSTATAAQFDARFAVTGGALVAAGEYALGGQLGMTLTVENNNFTGACAASWHGGAKGQIGAIAPIEPPVQACYDVKTIKIRDGKKHYHHYGSYGESKSKISASLSAGCPTDFDPALSLVSLSLDGETFTFPMGSFSPVGSSARYRAWIAGSPSLDATLDCDKGRFTFNASKADTSQIDNSDGVDVTLVLGDWDESKNVVLSETGHQHWNKGQNNVLYFHNDDAQNCAVDLGDDDTDMEEVKCRHRASGRIYTFKRSKGGYGKNMMVYDPTSGQFASFDTSKTSALTCGSGDANFEIVEIEHKLRAKSCTLLDEVAEDDDVEDNQYD